MTEAGKLIGAAIIAAVTAMGGCTRIETRMTTYLSREVAFPARGDTVAVIAVAQPKEPLLEREVQRKAECLLRDHGLEVRGVDEARYVLFLAFGIETTSTFVTEVYGNRQGTYLTGVSRPLHGRWLIADLYDARRFGDLPKERKNEAIAWRATTNSVGSSADLRDIIDYLLVATFDYFGDDTGKQLRRSLLEGDKRVKTLRSRMSVATGGHVPEKHE